VALHQLSSITIGVPNVEETCRYYAELGLTRRGATFSTSDGGEQLSIVESPTRRLIELCVGADDPDDVARVSNQLSGLGIAIAHDSSSVSALEIHSGARVVVKVLPRMTQDPAATEPTNGPGCIHQRSGTGHSAREARSSAQARPRRHWHARRGGVTALLRGRSRVQGQ
jgi:hypothetical protein